jgi:hypothetical protein
VFHANKVNRKFSVKNGTNLQNREKRAEIRIFDLYHQFTGDYSGMGIIIVKQTPCPFSGEAEINQP